MKEPAVTYIFHQPNSITYQQLIQKRKAQPVQLMRASAEEQFRTLQALTQLLQSIATEPSKHHQGTEKGATAYIIASVLVHTTSPANPTAAVMRINFPLQGTAAVPVQCLGIGWVMIMQKEEMEEPQDSAAPQICDRVKPLEPYCSPMGSIPEQKWSFG